MNEPLSSPGAKRTPGPEAHPAPAPAVGPLTGQPQQEPGAQPRPGRRFIVETVQVLAPALLLAMVIHLFLAQATVVYGQSMAPNLEPFQRLIIDKLSYRFHPPQRHDIVVLDLPGVDELLVKRVVGLPGEEVAIRRGVVYVDGQPLAEPFPHGTPVYDVPAVRLGPLSYFVLGDNRSNSNDSRFFGPVTASEIVGRVWLRYWPLDEFAQF
jgi:signal peptidase I